MNRTRIVRAVALAALALGASLVLWPGSAWAQRTQYLDDGAIQNPLGGWDLPAQGTCSPDATQVTRPDCLALRIVAADSAACTAASGSWTTSGVCNDTETDEATCEAQAGRLWNSGTAKCAVTMKGDDRNNVTCAILGGTWVTAGTCTGNWVMPDAISAYEPDLLTSNGAGDQCFRCHNSVTQYNGPRLRDVDGILGQGHKNILKKVIPGVPQYGAGEATPYPTDEAGNVLDWNALPQPTVTVGGVTKDLFWFVNNWMAPLGRSFYDADHPGACSNPLYTTESSCVANGGTWTPTGAGLSYSCARCHSTGWTSDATLNADKEPENSFPGVTYDPGPKTGYVNLRGGITGDANNFASWDLWGIGCDRCHMAVVNNTGGALPYVAPAGMASHHNNLTPADFPAGCSLPYGSVCSGGRCTSSNCATATPAPGVWNYGYCTDPRFLVGGLPFADAKSKCETGDGMGQVAPGFGPGVWVTPCSDNNYGNSAACVGAGATWTAPAASSCSVAGICSTLNPAHNSSSLCTGAGGWWAAASDIIRCVDIHEYGKEHDVAAYEAARWTGNFTQRGQVITALCMNCHRSDSSGIPREPTSLLAGNSHGALGLVGHAVGQAFLNSPHAKYTGTFAGIPTGKFKMDMTGEYKSWFMSDGEAANTGNGCTGCHDVHQSFTDESAHPIKEECTECHAGQYAKDLTIIQHPNGPGTPIEDLDAPDEACIACHMPEPLLHLWRVNADPGYRTFPVSAVDANVAANTAPDGTYTQAVWNDVDLSCGRCHGGGSAMVASTITAVNSTSTVLTVASATGFEKAAKVKIPGAGGLEADGVTREDFHGVVKGVAGNQVTLLAAPSLTGAGLVGRTVTQNFTENGAQYRTKAQLAANAEGIHPADLTAAFAFNYNGLTVNVNASRSVCNGNNVDCDSFSWNWGDGTPDGTGVTATHVYATAGTKTIVLTVTDDGDTATRTKTVTLTGPPVPAASCVFTANTWALSCTDSSTGLAKAYVTWGDGSLVTSDLSAPFGPYNHIYLLPGTWKVYLQGINAQGVSAKTLIYTTAPAQFTYFTIGGNVYLNDGTTPVAGAKVEIKRGTTFVKNVYSSSLGAYSTGNLKPGSYTLTFTKTGLTFPVVAPIAIGPNGTQNVNANP